MIQAREELTAREREQMQHEKEMFSIQASHAKEIRTLELEVAKLEAKWSSWLKIPLTIIKLPLYLVFGIAYCICVGRKIEPSEHFWRLLK